MYMFAPTPVEVERAEAVTASDWDAFASRCGASYRGLGKWMRIWQVKQHIRVRMRRFDFRQYRDGAWVKIGQCAVGVGPRRRVFGEGIQLLPQYQHLWSACMQSLLTELGPGEYVYGSEWSFEPPREQLLAALSGISVTNVERHVVESVDFSRWGSWAEYERAISTNIRRNISRARASLDKIEVDLRRGAAALPLMVDLLSCNLAMARRRRLPIRRAIELLVTQTLRLTLTPEHSVCAVLRNGRSLAAFGGAEVGQISYYLYGGSRGSDGAGWALMMDVMREFHTRHPQGRFVMGSSPLTGTDVSRWESAVRYRRDSRVSPFPTSVVTFKANPPSKPKLSGERLWCDLSARVPCRLAVG